LLEGGEDGGGGGRGGKGVTTLELSTKIGEIAEGFILVGYFVAEVVGDAAEGVDVAEVLTEMPGEQDGDDGEVFVVGVCE